MSEHAPAPTSTAPFSPQEVALLREEDVKAAKSVVLLMIGVFLAGVVLYSIVALTL